MFLLDSKRLVLIRDPHSVVCASGIRTACPASCGSSADFALARTRGVPPRVTTADGWWSNRRIAGGLADHAYSVSRADGQYSDRSACARRTQHMDDAQDRHGSYLTLRSTGTRCACSAQVLASSTPRLRRRV